MLSFILPATAVGNAIVNVLELVNVVLTTVSVAFLSVKVPALAGADTVSA